MKNIKRWLPIILAITGYIVPVFLIVFGCFYGNLIENRTSGDGPTNIVWIGFFALPIMQLSALVAGIFAWRTFEGKAGVIAALAVLFFYVGYWLRWF